MEAGPNATEPRTRATARTRKRETGGDMKPADERTRLHTVVRLIRERAAAWEQTDREREHSRRLMGTLRWMANQPCRHGSDGGVCLSCYAANALRGGS